MANVTGLRILNSADKVRHYSVCIGAGAPAETTDPLVADVKVYPLGSTYTDTTGKNLYARVAIAKAVADWQLVGSLSLQADVTEAQEDITTLQGLVTPLQGAVAALQTAVTALQEA